MNQGFTKKFTQLAKNECSNYAEVGPFKKRHQCCFEPRWTDSECLILHDIPCRWFRDAVLPLKPELKPDWEAFLKRGDPSYVVNLVAGPDPKQCSCGATFMPHSNRQRSCPICSVKQRKIHDRARSQKYRQRKAVAVGQSVML